MLRGQPEKLAGPADLARERCDGSEAKCDTGHGVVADVIRVDTRCHARVAPSGEQNAEWTRL